MFEALGEAARRLGERRAAALARRIASDAAEAAPAGVGVEAAAEGIVLSGRGLGQRMLREPALRWLIERVR